MLQTIRRCVEASLSAAERDQIDLDRFLCLDVSRGRLDGCCCLFFDRGGDGPSVVAKATRAPERMAAYRLGFDNLRRLDATGFNSVRRTTPRALGCCEEHGVLVTLQSVLPGRLMRNLPARELFSPERASDTVSRVGSWSRGLEEAFVVERRTVDEATYEAEVLSLVRRFLGRYIVEPDEVEFLKRRFERERRLFGQELPFTVGHGDFCTANLVVQEAGIAAFDWEQPLTHRLPFYDLFFFFSSTRFPFRGLRRESSYSESLLEVFWGTSYLNALLRRSVAEACAAHVVPPDAVSDLFLLALLLRAERKYDVMLQAAGLAEPEPSPPEEDKRQVWRRLRGLAHDAPLFSSRDGVLVSLRHAVRRGLPAFDLT